MNAKPERNGDIYDEMRGLGNRHQRSSLKRYASTACAFGPTLTMLLFIALLSPSTLSDCCRQQVIRIGVSDIAYFEMLSLSAYSWWRFRRFTFPNSDHKKTEPRQAEP